MIEAGVERLVVWRIAGSSSSHFAPLVEAIYRAMAEAEQS